MNTTTSGSCSSGLYVAPNTSESIMLSLQCVTPPCSSNGLNLDMVRYYSASSSSPSSSGISTGAIIGLILGVVIIVCVFSCVIFFICTNELGRPFFPNMDDSNGSSITGGVPRTMAERQPKTSMSVAPYNFGIGSAMVAPYNSRSGSSHVSAIAPPEDPLSRRSITSSSVGGKRNPSLRSIPSHAPATEEEKDTILLPPILLAQVEPDSVVALPPPDPSLIRPVPPPASSS